MYDVADMVMIYRLAVDDSVGNFDENYLAANRMCDENYLYSVDYYYY